MYFDRFIALGNNTREINDMVLKFDVSITVPEYVYLTKAEIMAKGRQEYNEFSECVKAYETDPISALERYGPNAKKYYSAKNTTICCKDRDMEKYYQLYIHDYCFCDKIDSEGSVLSCCNPDAKWDSCSCEAKGNLRNIYAEAERRRRIYVPDKDRLTWDIVVNHNRNKLTDEEYIEVLANNPSRAHLLARYETVEKYITSRSRAFAYSWAIVTPDGIWHEREKDRFYAHVSERMISFMRWEEEYCDKILKAYPENTQYCLFEYHN